MAKSITLTLGYEDSDFTRQMKLDNVSDTDAVANTVRAKIQAVNASLSGGTAGGLSTVFLGDSGEHFTEITAAQIDDIETSYLDLSD